MVRNKKIEILKYTQKNAICFQTESLRISHYSKPERAIKKKVILKKIVESI